jgi:hypothetical protein
MKSSFSPASPAENPRSAVPGGLALALVILVLGACAGGPAARSAREAEAAEQAAPAPEPQPAPVPEPKSMGEALEELYAEAEAENPGGEDGEDAGELVIPHPEPPDGVWLADDQGRQYFVTEIPKLEGHYRRLEDGRLRLRYGYILDVVEETEDSFLVKIYKTEPVERPDTTPTPEAIAAVEASYRADLPVGQSLTFRDFGAGLPQQAQWRNGFDVADMNGDGHPDIVHGAPRRGFSGPFVFLGDGAGKWTHWREARFPPAPYDYGDAEGADFDGDGTMDLALAVHLSGFTVLAGDGEGGFTRWDRGLHLVTPGEGDTANFVSRTIASVDWDGDGRRDLVALSEGPRHPKATDRREVSGPQGLAVYRNHGDGSWSELESMGGEDDLFGDSVAVGDFDGDGRADLAAGTNALGRRRLVFLNRGGESEAVYVEAIRPLSLVWAVGAADVDGDGLDDLAVSSSALGAGEWWTAVDVLLARKAEDGTLSFERRALAGGRDALDVRVTALAAGDVDGDGDIDLVAATSQGVVSVYIGDGRGGFVREREDLGEATPGCRGYHVEVADLDSDGAGEIVAAFAGENCPDGGSLRAWKTTPK